MSAVQEARQLDPKKFRDPMVTAGGQPRAHVELRTLDTLWVNTGTLCNIECVSCYIKSSPRNDRLAYISEVEVAGYLDEIATHEFGTRLVGFTGGEPFMNPGFLGMLTDTLDRGYQALVLTNAMKPMWNKRAGLLKLHSRFTGQLTVRVSMDHYTSTIHESERGPNTWKSMLRGLSWLHDQGFTVNIAGRNLTNEPDTTLREGFGRLFDELGLTLDSTNPLDLVIFPEMDANADVPEISEACWEILSTSPDAQMCASARMVVKRKGADAPAVLACTLLPYDERFELGTSLTKSGKRVQLNHPHCARFCVLGGASCST
ncbi:MAG: radical SAM protein [Rhodospirillaceae bacterium]|nr:radical SAM protein [Rhodospirillaceae bacterium]